MEIMLTINSWPLSLSPFLDPQAATMPLLRRAKNRPSPSAIHADFGMRHSNQEISKNPK
jgi:hypothetical protein